MSALTLGDSFAGGLSVYVTRRTGLEVVRGVSDYRRSHKSRSGQAVGGLHVVLEVVC